MRIYPPIFLISKVGEDPQEFVDGVYKVLRAMGLTYREKTELAFVPIKGGCSSVVYSMER